MAAGAPFRVCFVCLGNICRSPMADVVMREAIVSAGLTDRIESSSAGIGDWHVGQSADPRTLLALERAGHDGAAHRARQFAPAWFDRLDLIVALDSSHERALKTMAPDATASSRVHRLLALAEFGLDEDSARLDDAAFDVLDPYFDDNAFDSTMSLIDGATRALLTHITTRLDAAETDQGDPA